LTQMNRGVNSDALSVFQEFRDQLHLRTHAEIVVHRQSFF